MTKQTYIEVLKSFRHLLPKQTIKTLRGQALSDNIGGAIKGLVTALRKANVMDMSHRQATIMKKYYDVDYKAQFQCSLKESHRLKSSIY